jgi:NAD+-dependent farnesol dehydrogenase
MILLTGATGYLGSQIAHALIARQIPFRVLVRDDSRLNFIPGESGCEVVLGELGDPEAVRKGVHGADVLIHSAALVRMWVADRREFRRVNVEALQALFRAAVTAGVQRIVYTSSFVALGPSSDPKAGEALERRGPYFTDYEQSKAEALLWLRGEAKGKFPVITLFPGVIYGPGPATEGNMVGNMIDRYLSGNFSGILGSGNQRWSFAYNGDVVNAHLAALEKGTPGEEYVLAGDNRCLNDFFKLLADCAGVKRSVRHSPFIMGALAARLEVLRAKWGGRQPQLTPGVVKVFRRDWVYSSAKAQTQLGYRVTPLEKGLKMTLEAMHA